MGFQPFHRKLPQIFSLKEIFTSQIFKYPVQLSHCVSRRLSYNSDNFQVIHGIRKSCSTVSLEVSPEPFRWSSPRLPLLSIFPACSQPFSCESSGNPTHMGPHMLSKLCVCVCVYACVCVRACMSMCLHSDIPRRSMDACAAQRRNSVNSAKQEMNEVMYGGASRWPSVATKGRARADGSRLRPLQASRSVCSCSGGGGRGQVGQRPPRCAREFTCTTRRDPLPVLQLCTLMPSGLETRWVISSLTSSAPLTATN